MKSGRQSPVHRHALEGLTNMVDKEQVMTALHQDEAFSEAHLDTVDVAKIAETCLRIIAAEAQMACQSALTVAAEMVAPEHNAGVFAGQPWDMGFYDGRSTAADTLRSLARDLPPAAQE